MATIAVVGAGMAGLSAALSLSDGGHEVVVFEARDRVGGRVLSHTFSNGAVTELGGEWITTDQVGVAAVAKRFNLTLVPVGIDFGRRTLGPDRSISEEEHERAASAVASAIGSLDADTFDHTTAASVFATVDDHSDALLALRLRIEGSAGTSLSEVGASEMVGDFGIGGASYVRVNGGNQQLALAIADSLDVRLEAPITRVDRTASGMVLQTNEGPTREFDGTVIAVPLPVLRMMEFRPPLGIEARHAIDTLGFGVASKYAAPTEGVPPLGAHQHDEDTWWAWTGNGIDGYPRRAVTGFAGGASAGKDPETWSVEVEQLTGVVQNSSAAIIKHWADDEWAGGCYSALGPGQEALLEDLLLNDRVVIAGEHTTGSGSIDGAILSGQAAAARIVASLPA